MEDRRAPNLTVEVLELLDKVQWRHAGWAIFNIFLMISILVTLLGGIAIGSTEDGTKDPLLYAITGAVAFVILYALFFWAIPRMHFFKRKQEQLQDALRLSRSGDPGDESRARTILAKVAGALKPGDARAERIARHGEP